jgi:predicted NAD/FAD-binding protein
VNAPEKRKRIAVVGTGVSGLVAAHMLHPHHDVTVFEADSRIGGHVNTIDVTVDGRDYAVDTGFIVYNERNYPHFTRLLRDLRVETQPTDMSFGVSDATTGIEYAGSNLNTLFAQRRNLLSPSYVRFLTEIARFNRAARRLVDDEPRWHTDDRLPAPSASPEEEESLADFVARHGYSDTFVQRFLVPFGAAIWSADPETFTRFPVRAYARFMHNHGLLELRDRPQWRTITGGSRTYVDALVAPFADRIRVATPVQKIVPREQSNTVEVLTEHGPETFDRVIVASHSDQALRLLGDPTPAERNVLGAIGYQRNTATLHTDPSLLPKNARARASWNYALDPNQSRATVTYWMNRLQSIDCPRPLLVTLNRRDAIDDRHVLAELEYDHPVFDAAAMVAQRARHRIQGTRGVHFAGAYWGYGFHEDGVQSGREVVAAIEAGR